MADLNDLKLYATALAAEAWPDDKAGPALATALLAHLLEEAGELAGAVRSLYGRSLRPDVLPSLDAVRDEAGDVGVIWLRICECVGVDPEEAVRGALLKFDKRIRARRGRAA